MPAPIASQLSEFIKNFFRSKQIDLPENWTEADEQFNQAFAEHEKNIESQSSLNLFQNATSNLYHVNTSDEISYLFDDYIERISQAICDGIDKWLKMASIGGVSINGSVGILMEKCLIGPPLMPLIMANAPLRTQQEIKYSTAIATALSNKWQAWHMGLTGSIIYPLFAAYPGPFAPPTPNQPVPLIAFYSLGENQLSPDNLKTEIKNIFGISMSSLTMPLFDSISNGFYLVFQTFKMNTCIQNLLGTGPVPTFTPVITPVGPVLGGWVLTVPGVLV